METFTKPEEPNVAPADDEEITILKEGIFD
jgi:hypothetical protein